MDPLLFTSPLSKADYLGGRFLAALAVNALLLLAVPLAELVATTVPFFRESVGPFQVSAYVQAYLIFLLPNLVLVGAFLFTVAMLTRKVIPVYLGAVALFIGLIAALNSSRPSRARPWRRSPTRSVSACSTAVPRYWTVAERNSQLLGFTPVLLWNRAIWLAVAAALLALVHHRFRFAHRAGGADVRKRKRILADSGPERAVPVTVPLVAGVFGRRTRVRQTLALARFSLEGIARSPASLLTFAGCAGMVLLWGWNVGSTVFDTSTWPVTHLVADVVFAQRIVPIVLVLIAVYAGELVWKDRDADVAEIADAAPVSDGVVLLGRSWRSSPSSRRSMSASCSAGSCSRACRATTTSSLVSTSGWSWG